MASKLIRLLSLTAACCAVAAAADPLVVAHRGSTQTAPENTLAALDWAVRAGADIVELDVRRTVDGHLIVIHDKRVNRTTDGRGYVHKMTLAEIRTLDAGGGEQIPTLAEVLDSAAEHDVRLLLDVKDSRRIEPQRLAAVVHRHPMRSRVIIGSRSVDFLAHLQADYPDLVLLGFVPRRSRIEHFLALEVNVIRLRVPWLARQPGLAEYVRGKRRAGLGEHRDQGGEQARSGAAGWRRCRDHRPPRALLAVAQRD